MKRWIAVISAAFLALPGSCTTIPYMDAAHAQAVILQAGPATQGHVPAYVNPSQVGSQPAVMDSGPAGGGGAGVGLSELNVTARGTGTPPFAGQGTGPNGEVVCVQDAAVTTGGYHYLCLSANVGGDGLISYGAVGTATPGVLDFIINGVSISPVNCSGSPTSSFAVVNGIVTHC